MNQIKVFRPVNLSLILLVSIVFGSLGGSFSEICSQSDYGASILSLTYGGLAMLVAAGGYLINDVYDLKIDEINHPNKKLPFSVKSARTIYAIINAIVVVVSLLFFEWEFSLLFFILPIWLLWLYSFLLKRWAIIGNLVVSFLALLLPLGVFLLFADEQYLKDNHSIKMQFVLLLLAASFLSTFSREIIKDIQDVKGDEANNCKTFPILVGKEFAAIFAAFILLILLLVWGNFGLKNINDFPLITQVTLLLTEILLLGALIALFVGKQWESKTKWSSLLIKLAMLVALVTGLLY